jgi:hypothetical protein
MSCLSRVCVLYLCRVCFCNLFIIYFLLASHVFIRVCFVSKFSLFCLFFAVFYDQQFSVKV